MEGSVFHALWPGLLTSPERPELHATPTTAQETCPSAQVTPAAGLETTPLFGESLASKETVSAGPCSVEYLDGPRSIVLLRVAEHIESDPVVNVLLGSDTVDRLLHLAMAPVATLHRV